MSETALKLQDDILDLMDGLDAQTCFNGLEAVIFTLMGRLSSDNREFVVKTLQKNLELMPKAVEKYESQYGNGGQKYT
jgi:hypothetical protein